MSVSRTGLRNLAGTVRGGGTVSHYAVTAASSTLTDQGAGPNSVVAITDQLSSTTLPGMGGFTTLQAPISKTVFRGVPETPVPEPATLGLLGMRIIGLLTARWRCANQGRGGQSRHIGQSRRNTRRGCQDRAARSSPVRHKGVHGRAGPG